MSEKDELSILIHSMDKNEKGYFKKFAGLSGQKNSVYVRLFDCISSMKEYDAAKVKAAFKGEKVSKHLSVTKHYLKNLVIRSLRNYHEEQMPYVQDCMALADTHIMLSKELYKSAGKRILKEKQNAIAGEKFLASLQWIILQDRWLVSTYGLAGQPKEVLDEVYTEKKKIIENYLNYSGYLYLRSVIVPLSVQKAGPEDLKKLDFLSNHPLLSSNKMPQSNMARFIYTEILCRIYHITNQREKGAKVLGEQIAYFEDPKHKHPRNPFYLFLDLNMLLNFMGREDLDQMPLVIDKCKKVLTDNGNLLNYAEKKLIQQTVYQHEMRIAVLQRRPEVALLYAQKLKLEYEKSPPPADDEISYCLLQAIAYFAMKRFDQALDKLNLIFTQEITKQNYLLHEAYLLNIMVHLELGNYSIIKRQFTIAKNFLKKNYYDGTNELWVFSELGQLAKQMQKGNRKGVQAQAADFLKELRARKILDNEHLEDWLETKLGKK